MNVTAMQDPLTAKTRQLGERVTDATNLIARLTAVLGHIDKLRAELREAGVTVDVDLGDVGNACAVARRQTESVKGPTFALPKAS